MGKPCNELAWIWARRPNRLAWAPRFLGAAYLNSDEPQALQRRVAVAADDDVVVHRDAERLCDRHDFARHRDVLRRGRRIAGRVVVDEATNPNQHIDISILLCHWYSQLGRQLGAVRRKRA